MRMPPGRCGATFAGMPFPARGLSARIRGLDRVRVDELAALVLLIEIELQVWLSPYVQNRVPAAVGALVLSVAVAVRRRWPLAAVLVGVCAVAGQDVFGGRLTEHAIGAILAGILVVLRRRRLPSGSSGASRSGAGSDRAVRWMS